MIRIEKDISVIFPAYNEEENIEVCVLVAHCILNELMWNFEIIIVDDGSTDSTKKICNELAGRLKEVRVISKDKNEGYGCALRDGFKAARFEYVFFSDSDRQFDIMNLKDLFAHAESYDIVIGFRKNRQDPWKRKFLSWGYNRLCRILFALDVRDIDCAFKLFQRSVFDTIAIESKQFFVNTEILCKASAEGMKIKEVGVSHFPRVDGISKVGFVHIPRTLREITRIYHSIQEHKKKGR